MTGRHLAACVLTLAFISAPARAADWPQWRGPARDGVVPDSPPLLDALPPEGLKEVWKSEKVLAGDQGGYGSVSVAEGRAYVYSNWVDEIPIDTRTLSKDALDQLGWSAGMPAELRDKVEAARTSDERAKLDNKDLGAWVANWSKENIPESLKAFRAPCERRLSLGAQAMPIELLAKLEPIKGKEFPNQAELDQWLQANGFEAKWQEAVRHLVPVTKPVASDKFFCFDAATGKTLWRVEYPGRPYEHPSSSTPCIVNGRCYVAGSDGMAYCFDAVTGREIWKTRTKANRGNLLGSSFVIQDGVAVLLAGPLTGFNPDTGEILWTQPKVNGVYSSAVYWPHGDKTYLVVLGDKGAACFEPATGNVLWQVPGSGWSTPTVSGDYMVLFTNDKDAGLIAWKMAVDKPEKAWSVSFTERAGSPVIHDGYVYAVGGSESALTPQPRAICVELQSGKIAWEQKLSKTAEISSPVVADGKLLILVGSSLWMFKASPEKYELLGRANLEFTRCTSPAMVGGKMFLRLKDAVVCYDLARQPAATQQQ